MNIDDVRFYGAKYKLLDYSLVFLKGVDREKFIQSHVTSDFNSLKEHEFQLATRLDLGGKVQAFYYLGKMNDQVAMVIPNAFKDEALGQLDKYIIMEDVVIEPSDESIAVVLCPFIKEILDSAKTEQEYLKGCFLGEDALFLWGKAQSIFNNLNLDELPRNIFENMEVLSGWPSYLLTNQLHELVNNTTLNEYAVSYSKGCFLGQETISKVHFNRGAAYYPVLLKVSDEIQMDKITSDFFIEGKKAGTIFRTAKYAGDNYLFASLFREFRVNNKKYQISLADKSLSVTVLSVPFFKNNSREDKAVELYENAVAFFQKNESDKAISLLEHAIELKPDYSDAYESLGVIEGKLERYDEALATMDRLLQVNPKSIMAHTNKSLFYMKMGKIEQAEIEKAKATTKSFELAGENAQVNEFLEKERAEKIAAMKKRENMFMQVLEIDSEDALANFGMGEISFHRKNYGETVKYLKKALVSDPQNAKIHLLMGKSYEALDNTQQAKEIYEEGVKIASKKGMLKEANEMHERLARF